MKTPKRNATPRDTQTEGLVRGIGDADLGKIFITSRAVNGQRATFSAGIGIAVQPEIGRFRMDFWANLSYSATGFIDAPQPKSTAHLRAENTTSIILSAESTDLIGQDPKFVASIRIDLWRNRGASTTGQNSISESSSLARALTCNVSANRIYYFWVTVETMTSTQVDLVNGGTTSCNVDLTLTVPNLGIYQF